MSKTAKKKAESAKAITSTVYAQAKKAVGGYYSENANLRIYKSAPVIVDCNTCGSKGTNRVFKGSALTTVCAAGITALGLKQGKNYRLDITATEV